MYNIWAVIFLLINSITDLKKKTVYLWICLINFIMALTYRIVVDDIKIKQIIYGMLLASAVWMISVITKGAIGRGDAAILGSLSPVLGIHYMLNMVYLGLALCAVFSTIGLVIKKLNNKSSIPFIPFLFLAQLCNALIVKGV